MGTSLEQNLSQRLQLTKQMEQSLKILQMDHLELAEYIQALSLENPVLDVEAPAPDGEVPLSRKVEWLEEGGHRSRIDYSRDDEEEDGDWLQRCRDGERSMEECLLGQLLELKLPEKQRRAAAYLIGCLDDNGYLHASLEELAAQSGMELAALKEGLDILRQMEPAGVGAATLSECILLQLERQGLLTPQLRRVVEEHLERLGRGSYRSVAEAIGCPVERVKGYARLIGELNPKPCASLGRPRYLRYIQPDLVVVRFRDHLDLLLGDYAVPRILVRRDYLSLLRQEPDAETTRYIEGKLRQADWVVQAIEKRSKTLLAVGRYLVEHQSAFFFEGAGHIVPLRLADVADALGVHPSTVSRAIGSKYLQCAYGVYPLKYFFAHALKAETGQGRSNTGVRERLRQLIEGEDAACPYSDARLSRLLEAEGIAVSRRTVAKYREQLGIPAAAARQA